MYKNYNTKQVTLSLNLDIYLEENDIAFAIDELVESIPVDVFSVFEHRMGNFVLSSKNDVEAYSVWLHSIYFFRKKDRSYV